jgi:glycosyl transferase family 25
MRLKQRIYLPLSYLKLVKFSPKEVRNRLPQKISAHINKAGEHFCTHAYAVTQAGAKKLIAMQTPVIFNADLLLSKAIMNEQIKAYTFEPQFFAQEDFFNPQTRKYISG